MRSVHSGESYFFQSVRVIQHHGMDATCSAVVMIRHRSLTSVPSVRLATNSPPAVTDRVGFVDSPGIHPRARKPVAPSMQLPGVRGASPDRSSFPRAQAVDDLRSVAQSCGEAKESAR